MQQYDIIIAGSGAAGLSLAWYLSHSRWLEGRSVLLLDEAPKTANDRTWGFWTKEPTAFDAVVAHRFDTAEFLSARFSAALPLAPYQYQVIEGKHFYTYIFNRLKQFPNIHFRQEKIERMESQAAAALVYTQGLGADRAEYTYKASWVFNSCFVDATQQQKPGSDIFLKQHFKGWLIKSPEPVFNTETVRLFDFHTPQQGSMRFFYIIPHSPDTALVEFTLFSERLLAPEAYAQALRQYLKERLGLLSYEVLEEEWGVIPMTSYRFPSRSGKRIINIGSLGGATKASTGYTFLRIQKHCQALVSQLEAGQPPYARAESPARFRFYDAMLLNIMDQKGAESEKIFSQLFQKNPIARIFKFLDEQTHPAAELLIMNSVPRSLFIKSFLNLQLGVPLAKI